MKFLKSSPGFSRAVRIRGASASVPKAPIRQAKPKASRTHCAALAFLPRAISWQPGSTLLIRGVMSVRLLHGSLIIKDLLG